MKTFTTLALTAASAAVLLAPATVHAHGGMVEPLPRAISTMKLSIDSTFGHPIVMRASYTNGKGGNCLDFTPDSNLKALPTGKSKIKMRANDGANHVGLCQAFLVNPRDKTKKVQVGQLTDCMRSLHPGPGNKGDAPIPAEMTIDVPSDTSKLPCDNGHCVLEFSWEASHITPHELYNNCADVKVSGASGSGSAPAPAPAPKPQPNPAPAPKPQPNPAPAPAPVPAPAPKPATGKYVYIGKSGNQADLTQWCNWNCPNFCPDDMCKLQG